MERLGAAFREIEELPLGFQCKLFDEERLVIYGDSDIHTYKQVEAIFQKHQISLLGPAQDVWEAEQDEHGNLNLKVPYSNDSALGANGGGLPDEFFYDLKQYTGEIFLKKYLQLCLFTGKSPAAPYRTSFIYAPPYANPTLGESYSIQEEARRLCGYPVVFEQRPRSGGELN